MLKHPENNGRQLPLAEPASVQKSGGDAKFGGAARFR